MRPGPRHPSLYQINTRVWLTELSRNLGRPATLDDIPDGDLDRLAEKGFDWIWLLSVWRTGVAGQRISRTNAEWRREFEDTLPDLREQDIAGSGFAITGYIVHDRLGGDAALDRLRERLRARGLRLLLDFVPNHTGLDHPWVDEHPEYYVQGTEADLARVPQNYTRVKRSDSDCVLAYGRDPYFSGWPDTLQLNYGNPATQETMIAELVKIAGQCDGVRCDMAMLVLPDVFERTWNIRAQPFWPDATRRVRERAPGFTFMAEVYWDLEWTLQQQGFDFTYDKRLYDRLRDEHARPVREHFHAGLDYQNKLARFLENHDEPRAAATFAPDVHQAAAIITFLSPGLRFFHQGQFEGRRKRISPHLVRAPAEAADPQLQHFYDRLLAVLREPVVRDGQWQLLECEPAWEGNWTSDCFVASTWQGPDDRRLLVAVNYAPNQSQCFVRLPFADLDGRQWRFEDRVQGTVYDRDGCDLQHRGLYLDMRPWQACVFALTKNPSGSSLDRAVVYGVLLLSAMLLGGCNGVAVHDVPSLLLPEFQRSEVIGFVAGFGTTFAAVPDLLGMFRRRSSKGINPTMAGIVGVFQMVWIYYGLLIGSRPVIAWNMIGVLVNLLTVVTYLRFAGRQDRAAV